MWVTSPFVLPSHSEGLRGCRWDQRRDSFGPLPVLGRACRPVWGEVRSSRAAGMQAHPSPGRRAPVGPARRAPGPGGGEAAPHREREREREQRSERDSRGVLTACRSRGGFPRDGASVSKLRWLRKINW